MKLKLIYIFNVILMIFCAPVCNLFAQEGTDDTDPVFAVDIGFDLLKFSSFLVDFEQKYEVQGGILVKNYRFNGEYGYARLTPEESFENAVSKDEGTYWRAGIDYFMNLDPKNKLLFGVKYGQSNFDDEITTNFDQVIWSGFKETKKDLSADWYEVAFSTESRITGNLNFGITLRLRILNDFENPGNLDVFAIPGYGHAFNNSIPAFNIYIRYRLQVL